MVSSKETSRRVEPLKEVTEWMWKELGVWAHTHTLLVGQPMVRALWKDTQAVFTHVWGCRLYVRQWAKHRNTPTQRKRLKVYSQPDLAQFPPLNRLVALKVTVYLSFNLFVSRMRLILSSLSAPDLHHHLEKSASVKVTHHHRLASPSPW